MTHTECLYAVLIIPNDVITITLLFFLQKMEAKRTGVEYRRKWSQMGTPGRIKTERQMHLGILGKLYPLI